MALTTGTTVAGTIVAAIHIVPIFWMGIDAEAADGAVTLEADLSFGMTGLASR